ncbi:MAG: hypothetical protein JNM56_19810 [Planctomycetia bacterium]|nr:hypothetical protein [Planctomycetia bacterium]
MKKTLLGLACLGFAWLPVSAKVDKTDPVAETRAKYRKQAAEVLKIVEPIKVSDVFYYKDGGTIGIEITDAKEKKHLFCLDGRFLPTQDEPNNQGTRNLYLGAAHPTQAGARKVDMRGAEESALYGVLLRWADQHPHRAALYDEKADLSRKDFGNLWEIRAFFLRLDARYTQK